MPVTDKIMEWGLRHTIKSVVSIEATEVRLSSETIWSYHALLLLRNKNNITASKLLATKDIDDLHNWLRQHGDTMPIIFVVNSDKIIHKNLEVATTGAEEYLKQLVPGNNNKDEFLVQIAHNSNKDFVSFTRIGYLQSAIDLLGEFRKNIVQILLGPAPVFNTYKYVIAPNEHNIFEVKFLNYSLTFANDGLLAYNISPFSQGNYIEHKLQLGDETIDASFFIGYSAGINFMLQQNNTLIPVKEANIKECSDVYFFNTLSRPLVLAAGSILLLLLVISSVLFTIYKDKLGIVKSKNQQQLALWSQYQEQQGMLEKEQQTMTANGLVTNSDIAFYSDQLTYSLPDNIYLNKLTIHPVDTKVSGEEISFLTNKITIEGYCYSSGDLDAWISVVKAYSWVRSVTIKKYKQDNDGLLSAFALEVTKNSN